MEKSGFTSVFRNHRKSVLDCGIRAFDIHLFSVYENLAACFRLGSEDRIHHFASARSDKSRKTYDLALVKLEGNVLDLSVLSGKIPDLEDDLLVLVAVGSVLMLVGVLNRSADHHRDKIVNRYFADLLCSDVCAVLENRYSVADLLDLGKLMGNEYNSFSLFLQRPDNIKEMLNLLVCQRSRRLVHDDYLTVCGKSLGDLDLLLFRNADILNGFSDLCSDRFLQEAPLPFCSSLHNRPPKRDRAFSSGACPQRDFPEWTAH